MLNPQLSKLPPYPFFRLRSLLEPLSPSPHKKPIVLSVGEPSHSPPEMIIEILEKEKHNWGKYPPIEGTATFRHAVADWLKIRYKLTDAYVDPDRMVLPVAGTREALFLISIATVPRVKNGKRPIVAMPNPFYHVYGGAAAITGAEPIYLTASSENGFLPQITELEPATLSRLALFYFCSPANPQGAAASLDQLVKAIDLARRYDFILLVDECYSEIYDKIPPIGALQAAASMGEGVKNVLIFHSLSKRSSSAGLRSGFVAGDPDLIKLFRHLRSYVGPQTPLPILAAAEALWRDERHVKIMRSVYRQNFSCAEKIIEKRFNFYRPDGGFFLWLNVGNGENITKKLWTEAAIKVLPGAYLSHPLVNGKNPGSPFIRVALTHSTNTIKDAIHRIVKAI